MLRRWSSAATALVLLLLAPPAPGQAAAWTPEIGRALAAGGHVLFLRHAATEAGIGDPPGFRLDDCASQRNLSPTGREQARVLGASLRARGVPIAEVRSSRWCRCLDTAQLAFAAVASIVAWPVLDSFFGAPAQGAARTPLLVAAARAIPAGGNAVWVTHQVNITAATGVVPVSGEIVVARAVSEGFVVVARLLFE